MPIHLGLLFIPFLLYLPYLIWDSGFAAIPNFFNTEVRM